MERFSKRPFIGVVVAQVVIATLMSASLSACGGGNTTGGLAGAPAPNAIIPLTSTVEVTAHYGGQPISGVEIVLRHHPWPNGKLITKGKTGANGRVKLSGNFRDSEYLCVGGTYASHEKARCKQPFPKAVTLDF